MHTFLFVVLGVIIALILLPVIKMWLWVRKLRRKVDNMRQDGSSQKRRNNSSAGYEHAQNTGKVLNEAEEDAEFETVTGPRQESDNHIDVVREEQVTDAEFEEIK